MAVTTRHRRGRQERWQLRGSLPIGETAPLSREHAAHLQRAERAVIDALQIAGKEPFATAISTDSPIPVQAATPDRAVGDSNI